MSSVNLSFFEKMPGEIVLEVFKHLDGESLSKCAQACKGFNILSNHESVVTKKINLPKTINDIGVFIISMSAGFREEDKELSEIMGKPLFVKREEENKSILSIVSSFVFGKNTGRRPSEEVIADLYDFILNGSMEGEERSKALALCIRFFANKTLDFDYDKLREQMRSVSDKQDPSPVNGVFYMHAPTVIGTIIMAAAFLRERELKKELDMYDVPFNFLSLVLYPSVHRGDLKFQRGFSEGESADTLKSFLEFVVVIKYVFDQDFDFESFRSLGWNVRSNDLSTVRDIIRLLPSEIKEYFCKDVLQAFDPLFNKFLVQNDLKDGFINWIKRLSEANQEITLKETLKLNLTFKDREYKQMNGINSSPSFTDIPEPVALEIFSYLTPEEIGHCCCVSKDWKKLAEKESLWKALFLGMPTPSSITAKEYFKRDIPISQDKVSICFMNFLLKYKIDQDRSIKFKFRDNTVAVFFRSRGSNSQTAESFVINEDLKERQKTLDIFNMDKVAETLKKQGVFNFAAAGFRIIVTTGFFNSSSRSTGDFSLFKLEAPFSLDRFIMKEQ